MASEQWYASLEYLVRELAVVLDFMVGEHGLRLIHSCHRFPLCLHDGKHKLIPLLLPLPALPA
jgi:hypothetical protein